MNHRERWLQSILFGDSDKIPLEPLGLAGFARESTKNRWHREGLPRDVADITEYAYRQGGGRCALAQRYEDSFEIDEKMIPQFEEKVIEKGTRSQIVQDWKGNICEIGNEFNVEYLRLRIDFVTRRWIKCPVESRRDWKDMKRRYDPQDPARLPANPAQQALKLADRNHPWQIHLSGPFWQLREWLGFENLCVLFHDDPAFVHEMIEFWDDYISSLLKIVFRFAIPDSIYISEDMAYKGYSMISPAMVREFLFPTWQHWADIIKDAGVPIYAMDSDGFIGELIPLWIEAGINCCDPIEVAAGNDIVKLRREFGKNMAFRGGVDKRNIAAGGKAIEDEVKRITPVIHDGGYIPGCDHSVPSDVSWPYFVYYTKLLAKVTGWL